MHNEVSTSLCTPVECMDVFCFKIQCLIRNTFHTVVTRSQVSDKGLGGPDVYILLSPVRGVPMGRLPG